VVTATVRAESGRTQTIAAGYLVGCDGAHIRVRKLLDLPFTGQPYPWDFLLADTEIDWRGRADEVHVFSRPSGLPLACIPITAQLWRLSLPMPQGDAPCEPTLDGIQQLVDERSPWPITVSTPETLTTFRCQVRSTSTYRRGRALLAGDAAHIQSPVGGQGMNTGMLDAANLSWKLALVLESRATDWLLDTYGQERRPAAAEVLAFSDRMVAMATMRSVKRAIHRPLLHAYRLPAAQRHMAQRLSQVSTVYQDGCLAKGRRKGRRPRLGARCPNIEVITADDGDVKDTLFGVLRHGRHVLVVPTTSRAESRTDAAFSRYSGLVEVVSGDVPRWTGVTLVRPDGHIAGFGRLNDLSGIRSYFQTYATAGRGVERREQQNVH
jgi:hypothetical protein